MCHSADECNRCVSYDITTALPLQLSVHYTVTTHYTSTYHCCQPCQEILLGWQERLVLTYLTLKASNDKNIGELHLMPPDHHKLCQQVHGAALVLTEGSLK